MDIAENQGPYILAVDDDRDMLTVFSYLMTVKGFHVVISPNAEDFWELIQVQHPDIIFLDIHMKGINGMDICTALKSSESTCNIPVVLLSANESIESIARDCAADGFLQKPFITTQIVAEINRLVPEQ